MPRPTNFVVKNEYTPQGQHLFPIHGVITTYKCAYDCVRLYSTVQHKTVLLIIPQLSQQSSLLRCCLWRETNKTVQERKEHFSHEWKVSAHTSEKSCFESCFGHVSPLLRKICCLRNYVQFMQLCHTYSYLAVRCRFKFDLGVCPTLTS